MVLDFIGNYRKSYLIPIALSGDRSYNKDNIRRFIRESRHSIVGCSTIDFDEVSRDHIYRMLDAEKFGSVRLVRQEYDTLKGMLGRIPTLMDFREMGSVDPALIFSAGKLGSYHAFLSRYEKSYTVRFTEAQEQMLRYVSLKLSGGKRIQDLLMLRKVMEGRAVEESSFAEEVHAVSAALPVSFRSACRVLDGSHNTGSARQTYAEACFVTTDGARVIWSDALRQALSDPEFARQLREVIDIGLANFSDRYLKCASDDNLCLYAKYTYEDVCMMLEWEHNVSGQNIGGYKYDSETNTFPVFINYEKGEDIAETIRYHDRFRDPSHLIAISKQPRRMNSPEIERLRCARETNMRIYLFVRKNKDDSESKEFYYLGRMWPTGTFEPVSVAGKPAVEISYELTVPVAEELFDYLTSGEG